MNFQCLLCKEILVTSHTDESAALVQHVKEKHPSLTFDCLHCHPDADQMQHPPKDAGKPPRTSVNRKYKVKTEVKPSLRGRSFHKTTLEKSRKGNYPLRCPKCGSRRRPVIFVRQEMINDSSVAASLVFKFWTLCCIPALFPTPSREYMKCARCGEFLGVYDHQKQVVQSLSQENP